MVMFVPAYVMMIPERKLADFGLAAQRGKGSNWLMRVPQAMGNLPGRLLGCWRCWSWLPWLPSGGISHIRINDNYAKRFATGHPIRRADVALNSHFGGTYLAYLVLEGKDSGSATPREIQRINKGLIRFSRIIRSDYPEVPKQAARIDEKLSELAQKSPALEGYLDPAGQFVEAMADDAPDKDYYALQELRNYFGVEKEKGRYSKGPRFWRTWPDCRHI